MKIQTLEVRGDEWWLNPEFQPDHETRQEWRSRTFAFHYGRGPRKFSDYLNSFGTDTGRFSSSKLNLSNTPREESCVPEDDSD